MEDCFQFGKVLNFPDKSDKYEMINCLSSLSPFVCALNIDFFFPSLFLISQTSHNSEGQDIKCGRKER